MGAFSVWHWLIVLAIMLLLFGGGGKIPKLMRDLGQGVNAFKKGLKTDKNDEAEGSITERGSLEDDKAQPKTTSTTADSGKVGRVES